MKVPVVDVLARVLASPGDEAGLAALRERAGEIVAALDLVDVEDLEPERGSVDPDWLARVYEALAEAAPTPAPVGETVRALEQAHAREAGRAFEERLLPRMPGRLRDIRSWLEGAEIASHDLAAAADGIAMLVSRVVRGGFAEMPLSLPMRGEGDPLTRSVLEAEVASFADCDAKSAARVLDWLLEAAGRAPLLFEGFVAEPERDGVRLVLDEAEVARSFEERFEAPTVTGLPSKG